MSPRDAEIRAAARHFFLSDDFEPHFRKLNPPPRLRYLLAAMFAVTGVGIPFAIGLAGGAMRDGRKRARERRDLAESAMRMSPIKAFPLMANVAVTRGTGNVAPGLVIGSFDPALNRDPEGLLEVGRNIIDEMGGDPFVDGLFEDQAYRPDRRRRLPDGLTEGREVYAFDLMIVGDFLPEGKAESLIPCLADPGPAGRIVAFPWWLVPDWIALGLMGRPDEEELDDLEEVDEVE